mgnify:CR=1 FL=1
MYNGWYFANFLISLLHPYQILPSKTKEIKEMEQEIVFEKLKQIISEVFSIRPEDITMETAFIRE